MLALGTGLIAGALHAVSGPDHLAALAPIAIRDRARGMRVGATWGLGHGLGVCALGGLGLALREVVDISWLSRGSELLVGLVLIGIGIWAVRQATRLQLHTHSHAHDGDEHIHVHIHVDAGDHTDESAHKAHTHAALGVGFLHGAAGTGHIFGVVPALALPARDAAIYILAYLVAAVGSMALFGGLLGRLAQRSGTQWMRRLMMTSGFAAVVVGVAWTWESLPAA